MADKKTSQTQKNYDFLHKAFEEQVERLDAWYAQVDKLHKQAYEQADQAMENAAALNRASMRYAQALTQDVWEIGIESVRQAGSLFVPKA